MILLRPGRDRQRRSRHRRCLPAGADEECPRGKSQPPIGPRSCFQPGSTGFKESRIAARRLAPIEDSPVADADPFRTLSYVLSEQLLTKIKMMTGVMEVGLFVDLAKAAYFGNEVRLPRLSFLSHSPTPRLLSR
jgi:hypothetical protein